MRKPMRHIPMLFSPAKVGRSLVLFVALAFVLVQGFALRVHAQAYPAVVTVVMQPPFSPYLSDFLQPGQERVMLNVNFLDQSEPSWEAKIRLTIEGNGLTLRTSQPFYQRVTLSPGPNMIDLLELEQLFDFSKMDVQGTNKNDLVNAGRLPEGTYNFCVEVMDANARLLHCDPDPKQSATAHLPRMRGGNFCSGRPKHHLQLDSDARSVDSGAVRNQTGAGASRDECQ
jgi:hypothetical protein